MFREEYEFGEFHAFRSSSVIRLMTQRKMRLVGDVAHIVENTNIYRVLVEKPNGMNHFEDLRVGE